MLITHSDGCAPLTRWVPSVLFVFLSLSVCVFLGLSGELGLAVRSESLGNCGRCKKLVSRQQEALQLIALYRREFQLRSQLIGALKDGIWKQLQPQKFP